MQNNLNSTEELQRLLKDERDRCSLHKQNYQKIKDEYTKLQKELTLIYEQLKETRNKNEFLASSRQSEVSKLESKLRDQQREITVLLEKIKLLDSKKLSDAILEETTNHYESRIKDLELEADRMRDQYNNLHYENVVLRCKYDSRESDFARTLEKVKLEHSLEIEQLQMKIKNFEEGKTIPDETYAVELISAKREVLDLSSKVKVLLSECEELRAQNENMTLQINGLMRSNAKQSADHANNLRILESEKMKIMRQLEVCEKELANAQEHRKALNAELQASRQEVLALNTKIEEIEHNSRMMMANLQDEKEYFKSKYESEREELIEEINRLRATLRHIEENSHQEQQIMLRKEQEVQKDLINAKQQLWKLSNEVLNEREKMERKIVELTENQGNSIVELNREIDILRGKLQSCTLARMELEKELDSIRQSRENMKDNHNGNEANQERYLNYSKEITDLKQKFELLATHFSEQIEQNGASNQTARVINPSIEKDNEILQMKLTWEQQKLHFQQRLEELESQLRDCKISSTAEKRELEFKVKQYTNQVSKLREKLELQKEKLLSQKEMLEKCVSPEVHLQIKNQFFELQRRLEEYRRLITAEPNLSLKQPPAQTSKMLTDIKNIDFQSFLERATAHKSTDCIKETNRNIDKVISKKKSFQTRRKSLLKREKNSHSKIVSPVFTSSSDIDLENS